MIVYNGKMKNYIKTQDIENMLEAAVDRIKIDTKWGDKYKYLNYKDSRGNQMKISYITTPSGKRLYKNITFRQPGATKINGTIGMSLDLINDISSQYNGNYIVILNTYDDVTYFDNYLIDVENGDLLIKRI